MAPSWMWNLGRCWLEESQRGALPCRHWSSNFELEKRQIRYRRIVEGQERALGLLFVGGLVFEPSPVPPVPPAPPLADRRRLRMSHLWARLYFPMITLIMNYQTADIFWNSGSVGIQSQAGQRFFSFSISFFFFK